MKKIILFSITLILMGILVSDNYVYSQNKKQLIRMIGSYKLNIIENVKYDIEYDKL